jgi:hypothetical protein
MVAWSREEMPTGMRSPGSGPQRGGHEQALLAMGDLAAAPFLSTHPTHALSTSPDVE